MTKTIFERLHWGAFHSMKMNTLYVEALDPLTKERYLFDMGSCGTDGRNIAVKIAKAKAYLMATWPEQPL